MLLCVLNRKSCAGSVARRLPRLQAVMDELGINRTMLDLTAPDYFQSLCEALRTTAADAVLGIGGDGTHYSTINDLMRVQSDSPELALPPYAVCPFGTGNDVAKSLGLQPGRRHYRRILQTAIAGPTKALDLGRFEDQCFVDMMSFGMDAHILAVRDRGVKQALARRRRLVHGYLIYAWAACRGFLQHPRWQCRVTVDGKQLYAGRVTNILINNCPIHAGEFELTPGSTMDDGALDVVVSPGLLRYAWRYVRGYRFNPGFVRPRPGRFQARGTTIEIEADTPIPIQVDGESGGDRTRAAVTVKPQAVRFRIPVD